MKKIALLSLLVFSIVTTSCGKKENKNIIKSVESKNEVPLTILPYDGSSIEKKTIKFNVYVSDVAVNFSVDEELSEKTKKRIIKGIELNPVFNEINLVDTVDENTDVIIYGTIAKQTKTKIDARDVIVAYTINIVSAYAKNGKIIQSKSQTSDRSVEKTVSELKILNGDAYLQQGEKYFELNQYSDCITSCNKAIEYGASKEEVLKLNAEAAIELGEISMVKKYLDAIDAFNSEEKCNIYLVGKYYRLAKEYENAVNKLQSGVSKEISRKISEKNYEEKNTVAINDVTESIETSTTDELTKNNETELPISENYEPKNKDEIENTSFNFKQENDGTSSLDATQLDFVEIIDTEESTGLDKSSSEYTDEIKILEELALTYLEMNSYENASSIVKVIKANELNNTIALYVSSKIYSEQGDYQKAIGELNDIDDNSTLLLERARNKTELGMFESAQKDLLLAIGKNKISLEENKLYAEILYGLKEYDKALKYCDASVEFLPTAKDFYRRGLIFSRQNELEKAIEEFSKAEILDSSFKEAYYEHGKLFYENEQFDKAISFFIKSNDLGIDTVELYLFLAESYIQIKDFASSIIQLKKAEKLAPDNKRMLADMGISNLGQGFYSTANEYFEKRIGYKTTNPYLAMYNAISLHFSDSYTNAIPYYEQAIALFKESKKYKKWISFCETAIKECKKEKKNILSKTEDVFVFPITF